ncbi:MAG: S1/P1 Nuclease [Candidatus Eremiobacteraeota bacterium]|nr:S1/P1 Nuclease [Candidatus Eremiobacteraeota bacterium]
MKKNLTHICAFATVALAVAASSAPALAWGAKGHYIVNHLAAVSLPRTLPTFMRTAPAIDEIANLGVELDLLKGSGRSWDASNDPGHYVDLGDDNTIDGLPLSALPATREAYNAALETRGSNQYKTGYLPYSILEGWQQLRMDLAYWRVDAYEASHAPTVGIRVKAADRRRIDEALVLRDAGVWGHFVADASQPLHISVHFNGWGKYPNPNGYTQSKHVHDLFETVAVNRFISEAQVAKLMKPVNAPSYTRLVSGPVAMTSIARYLTGSNAAVPELYQVDKSGGYTSGSPQAHSFIAGRLAYGASELRDLILWAWEDSINETIGDDAPQRVRDIVSGAVKYRGKY